MYENVGQNGFSYMKTGEITPADIQQQKTGETKEENEREESNTSFSLFLQDFLHDSHYTIKIYFCYIYELQNRLQIPFLALIYFINFFDFSTKKGIIY